MKTFALTLLALILALLTWNSLGWIALLVVPSLALFTLMTFVPLMTEWAQVEEVNSSPGALKKPSSPLLES
ncbi:MAG: hypothetical protein ACOC9E_05100 [Chloroflexota bacterium]